MKNKPHITLLLLWAAFVAFGFFASHHTAEWGKWTGDAMLVIAFAVLSPWLERSLAS